MREHRLPPEVHTAMARYVDGAIRAGRRLGSGHIHQTYLLEVAGQRLVCQRFNTGVFADVDAVMHNVVRVTEHARGKLQAAGASAEELARRVLHVRLSRSGGSYVQLPQGEVFRVFDYVPAAEPPRGLGATRCAFEAGRAFGEFASGLLDLPQAALAITIPGFHDTPARLAALRRTLASDPAGRARQVEREWAAIEARAALAGECGKLAAAGALPLRITHNDAKLDNVLFDAQGRACCVIDLDTVMPGYLVHDFGDLVRTVACEGREDDPDPAHVGLDLAAFDALARGYLGELRGVLGPQERDALPRGALFIVYELAIRFLSDHVAGDTYFAIAREGHNLDRARAQLHLLEALERGRDALLHAFEAAARAL